MYITPLKTLAVTAFQQTFDASYPVMEFQNVNVGLEYPIDSQHYPSLWVDYDDTQPLVKAGIAHVETKDPEGNSVTAFTRWRFQGYLSVTVVSLTSLERDRLFDEVIRVVAFGEQDDIVGRFKDTFLNNSLIAVNLNTDRIEPRGSAAAPGTPWGTDELMYERTLNLEIIGEFVPNPTTGTLVSLSRIVQLPTETLDPADLLDPSFGSGLTEWH